MLGSFARPVGGLTLAWSFVPSRCDLVAQAHRVWARSFGRIGAPDWRVIRPVEPRARWAVYFAYTPSGVLSAAHRFTLSRLRDMGFPVLLIVAAQRAEDVDADALRYADALYWKSIEGYDFSAYAIALRAIANRSAHATVLVLNDSVLGPLVDVRPFITASPWELLGFTASSLHENHLQSYAFVLRDVTVACLAGLEAEVLPQRFAYSRDDDVIKCQELQLARLAARTMSVGACWYGVFERVADPMLCRPQELVAAGHPFLKRSVFGGKHHQSFQQNAQQLLRELLLDAGHPV